MASRRAAGPILFVALTLSACGWLAASPGDDEQRVERGPRQQAAEISPERIRVEPTQVAPGDELELFFPQEDARAVYYWLEFDVDATWDERYFAYAVSRSYNTDGDPHTVPTGEEKGWDDAGVTGPGPDRILVPEDASLGRWRVCGPIADGEFCAEFEVSK